jgi:hypothetical protein
MHFNICIEKHSPRRHEETQKTVNVSGSQTPALKPRSRSASLARLEAGASRSAFPSWSLGMSTGRIRYLGERLKDWVAQLLKALSSGRGLGEGKLSYLCPPSSGCAHEYNLTESIFGSTS